MNTFHKKRVYILISAVTLVWSSCVSDVWKEHYDNTDSSLSNQSLTDLIKSRSDLSDFKRMLEISGSDSILSSSQTYTVWAPVNNNYFRDTLNWGDTAKIKEIVRNHIARFNYPTAGFNFANSKNVYLLSGKLIAFDKSSAGYTFGSFALDSTNIPARNGILHVLNGFVPYSSNIWESIGRIAGLDSVYAFLHPLGSTPFGDINNEDSIYTTILPNNSAWIKSYNAIKPYFKCIPSLVNDSSAAKQRRLTINAIMQEAFFRGSISAPSQDSAYTLVTTSNHKYVNAARLFKSAIPHKTSNGYIWLSDSLSNLPLESWNQEIRIEAESMSYGRSSANANIIMVNNENLNYDISGNRFLVVASNSTSSSVRASAVFPIPNTLSTKYKVYCVFAPSSLTDAKPLPSYLNITLEYIGSSKSIVTFVKPNILTNTTQVSKILVGEFTFPFCNIVSAEENAKISVKMKVENIARYTQASTYNRTMLIDCIILEPVN